MLFQEIQTKNKEKTLVGKAGLSLDATVRSWCWSRLQLGYVNTQKGGV